MPNREKPAIQRDFFIIWLGEVVSLTGSTLTDFALGVWVYQQTGSTTQFALVSVFATLPGLLLSPVAGSIVDRKDRRRIMIFSNSGSALSVLAIAVLYWTARLEIWHIYVATAVTSSCVAFQWLAYTASMTLLVSRKHLARANGMVQAGQAVAQLIGPISAGLLLLSIGLYGIMLIDFVSFLFAITTLLLVRIPRKATAANESEKISFLHEAIFGWTYISSRRGLLGLLFFGAGANLLTGIVLVLITPLVLSFASAAVLGTVVSIAGSGMLVGSLVMSFWGGPRRRVYGILGFALVQGLLLIVGGSQASSTLIAGAAFCFLFCLPIINACSQTIWQSKVAPELQGRVFAARRVITLSTTPLAYGMAGPLADYVFEPLLSTDGPLAGSVGEIIGTGAGRGIGLLFMVLGLLLVILAVVTFLSPRTRLVEGELPDAAIDQELAEADGGA